MLSEILASEVRGLLKEPPTDRVWDRFTANIQGVDWLGCWMWLGSKHKSGYGRFNFGSARKGAGGDRAHRCMVNWLYGKLPRMLHTDHVVCSNPGCVNPLHLIPCKPRANVLRSKTCPSAINSRKSHCNRGHELSGDNLSSSPSRRGRGACKTCIRIKAAQRRETHGATSAQYAG